MHGHGRGTRLGTCLVEQQCVSCVHTLQHVLVFSFLGWAGACTRHSAWHTASVRCVWRGLCSRRHQCCMVLPKDVRTQIVQSCYTKQYSSVANSKQQSRSCTRYQKEKHNFSLINIFMCDDHASYLQVYTQACNDVATRSLSYYIVLYSAAR